MKRKYDVKDLIRVANEEYETNGASPLFEVCQKMVLESKSPKAIYLFCKNVKGCHVDVFEKAICETDSAKYMYFFAADVYGANQYAIAEHFVNAKGARAWKSNYVWFIEDGGRAIDRAEAIQQEKQAALQKEQQSK